MPHRARVQELTHDIRSPLSVIRGFAALLEGRDDEPFRLEAARRIQEAADRVDATVELLLEELVPADAEPRDDATRARVLVVDDDAAVRGLLAATLDAEVFEVVEARDAEEALALLDPRPALMILDWRVPGGGPAILAGAKRRLPSLPVVVLTGDGADDTRGAALAGGADAYLTKPFSPLALLAAVERLAASV